MKTPTQAKTERMLQSAKGLLETVNGIVDQYREKPLKLHASLIQSLGKSLNRSYKLIVDAAKLEEIDEAECEEQAGPGETNELSSFVVLQDLLQTWQDLEAMVDVIAKALRTDPSMCKATLLDAVSTFAGLSVKYADVAEHGEKEKQKATEMDERDGLTEEEAELSAEYAELEETIKELEGMYQSKPTDQQVQPGHRRYTTSHQSEPLETEEDYRYGINPTNKLWRDD